MKPIYLILIILILLPSIDAGMGRTFELDFNVRGEYDVWLQKSDRISFEYGDYNHTIIVDEIKNETVELDVFLFLERELHTPHYANLVENYDLGIDLNKDGDKELAIGLITIEPHNGKVHIIFKKLENWDDNLRIEFPDSKWNLPSFVWIGGLILGGIIIFISLISFFNRKKGVYF